MITKKIPSNAWLCQSAQANYLQQSDACNQPPF